MIIDNICILHCLHWVQRENRKGYLFRGLYRSYTASLHKGTNRHTSKILCAANILCCESQKTRIHYVHCLQEKIEKATFCKDYVYCPQPVYHNCLQVGTITYLMITDNTLSAATILCCASQKTWVHSVNCLQEKIEKAIF